ncbi:FAD-binding protein, partial [bacterium]|nr:FAD-binding protein [bacterium]
MPDPLNTQIVEHLRGIVGEKYVLLSTDDNFEKYEHDETEDLRFPPQVVVLPETSEQIQQIVRLASEHRIPIVPRGGGTGLSGGALATHGGICLSLERMNRILEI